MSQRVRTKLCFNRLLIPPHCQPEQSSWNLLETQGLSFQWKTTPSYEMWEGDTLSSPQPGEKGLWALLPGSKGACLLCLTAPCMRSSDRWHFAQVKVIGKTWRGSRAARLHLGHREGFEFLSLGHLPNGGLVWSRLSITLDTRVAGGPQQRWWSALWEHEGVFDELPWEQSFFLPGALP